MVTGYQGVPHKRGDRVPKGDVPGKRCDWVPRGRYPVKVVNRYQEYPNKGNAFRLRDEFKFLFYFECTSAIAYIIK